MDTIQKQLEEIARLSKFMTSSEGQNTLSIYKLEWDATELKVYLWKGEDIAKVAAQLNLPMQVKDLGELPDTFFTYVLSVKAGNVMYVCFDDRRKYTRVGAQRIDGATSAGGKETSVTCEAHSFIVPVGEAVYGDDMEVENV